MTNFWQSVIFSLLICINYYIPCICDECMDENCGEPLYLTPYIKNDKIDEARNLSTVRLPNTPMISKSYSGFLTVNETYNSNMFFWFVTSANGNKDAPLLLWLQGGPGTSSLMGSFAEHGPYFLHPNMTTGVREHAWTTRFHVLYVDNPVGAGFSYTDSEDGYVRNQEEVADDLYEFLLQFFEIFHDFRRNEFYIAGELFAGKHVPSIAYKIHMEGNNSNINLKGMAIGDGYSDPETMPNLYADYLYQIGLIDRKQSKVIRNFTNSIFQSIQNEDYTRAADLDSELTGLFRKLPEGSYFTKYTGYDFVYNYLFTQEPADYRYYSAYVENSRVREALHVGNLKFQNGELVKKYLYNDLMKSVKPKVEVLMDNYRVLYYSGQLQITLAYPTIVNFLRTVKWKYAEEYKEADRLIWRLNGTDVIAGYVHNVEDFYEVLVRNAGHTAPHDQPLACLDLITRFLNRESFVF